MSMVPSLTFEFCKKIASLIQRCTKIREKGQDIATEVTQIVKELGHLVLAITLAGSYVSETPRLSSDIRRHLPEYRERRSSQSSLDFPMYASLNLSIRAFHRSMRSVAIHPLFCHSTSTLLSTSPRTKPRQSYPSYIHINYDLILVRIVFQLIIEVFVSHYLLIDIFRLISPHVLSHKLKRD